MMVSIIGNGNVGTNLYQGFLSTGISTAIFARNPTLPYEKKLSDIVGYPHDVVILAVSDSSINDVAENLTDLTAKTILVHVSGATPIEVLHNTVHQNVGVIYPLQSITKDKAINWKKTPIFVQGSNAFVLEKLYEISNRLSEKVYLATNETRLVVHLSAVLTNNFFTHLANLSYDLLEENNIQKDILIPILENTFQNISQIPPVMYQTGPAVRGDKITMQRHLKLIKDRNLALVYNTLSTSISQYHAKN
jgi:predicted short-subunit dehydrogenase-like oxidoreductase (DUF2520 family)